MSLDVWTAAQDAENDADDALDRCAFCECPENDAALKALALAAAVACEAVAQYEWCTVEHFEAMSEPFEVDVECGRLARAIRDDYDGRAARWRKSATGGDTT